MKSNKGFVMIETIIVITILSIGLISLYSSYSVILSRAKVKNTYDNIEYIYKAYFVGNYVKERYGVIPKGFTKITPGGSTKAEISFIMNNLSIEKIYIINSNLNYESVIDKTRLDGSTIGYFNKWNDYEAGKLNFVVKFNKGTLPRPEINFASIALEKV